MKCFIKPWVNTTNTTVAAVSIGVVNRMNLSARTVIRLKNPVAVLVVRVISLDNCFKTAGVFWTNTPA